MPKKTLETSRIVIVAEGSVQRLAFTDTVKQCGYRVVACIPPEKVDTKILKLNPDLWLIDSDDCIGIIEKLTKEDKYLLGFTPAPKFTDIKNFGKWQRQLQRKLYQMLGVPATPGQSLGGLHSLKSSIQFKVKIQFVVVLGASMGGPKAVKNFLDHLPSDLPIAVVLAQHMDEKAVESLANVLCRSNSWQYQIARSKVEFESGVLYIAPPESNLKLHSFGMTPTHEPYLSHYKPCISQIFANAADLYRHRLISIVFSGMESDGSSAAQSVVEHGGQFWVQSPQTSECDSQPLAAIATGYASFKGSPEQLANKLAGLLK